jgi:uncharacterized membrane protein
MYELLKYIHIVAAIAWVGGGLFAQLLALRAQRSNDPSDLPRLGYLFEYFGLRYFLPASVTLFVAGLLMTAQRFEFREAWISISMALWFVSVLLGALYIGPRSKRVAELYEQQGPTSVAARSLMSRLFLVSRLELVGFAVIVALMVFKPGVGT